VAPHRSSTLLRAAGHTTHPPHLSPLLALLLLPQGNHYFERTAVSSPLPCIDFYWVSLHA